MDIDLYLAMFVYLLSIPRVYSNYIYYHEIDRKCQPILNCPPGNEIEPCKENFGTDFCTPCAEGKVQPDWLTSKGNLSMTSCFTPTSQCLEDDITYQRHRSPEHFCESLAGCKCDTNKCFFGDPCICQKSNKECEKDQYMNNTGACVPCPEGTGTESAGCGPCKTKVRFEGHAIPVIQKNVTVHLITTLTTSSQTTQPPSEVGYTVSSAPQGQGQDKTPSNEILIILITGLAVAIVVLIVLIVVCTNKWRNGSFYRCWTHNADQRERTDVEHNGQALIDLEERALLQTNEEKKDKGDKIKSPTTDGGKVTTYPVDNKNSEKYRHASSSESGFHDEDSSLDSANDNVQSCKNENTEEEKDVFSETQPDLQEHCVKSDNLDCSLDIGSMVKKENPYLSDGRSPVTTESEPQYIRRTRENLSDDITVKSDSSGYRSQQYMPSGTYLSMDERYHDSCITEEMSSDLERYTYTLKGKDQELISEINKNMKNEKDSKRNIFSYDADSGIRLH